MKLELSTLKPNPYRDFAVDPMDTDAIEILRQSITDDGFWGGVVGRKAGNTYEIAAGHHRVEAAIAAGLTHADIFIKDFDDAAMIRIYARENATQRGHGAAAAAGTVAAAIRYLARETFTPEFRSESRGGHNRDGIGEPAISNFLEGIPGVTKHTVGQQLKNLKESGDYARIIREVEQVVAAEIEVEQARIAAELEAAAAERKRAEAAASKAAKDAAAAADRAAKARAEEARQRAEVEARVAEERKVKLAQERKAFDKLRVKASDAADKAEEKEAVFDLAGVQKHLKTDALVNGFRDIVLSVGIKPYLPMDKQALLAEAIVKKAAEGTRRLSVEYIRDIIWQEVLGVRKTERRGNDAEAKAALAREELQDKAKRLQRQFGSATWTMNNAGIEIADLHRDWPKDLPFPRTGEFDTALERLRFIVKLFDQHGIK